MKRESSVVARLLAAIRAAPWCCCLSRYTARTLRRYPLVCLGVGLALALAVPAVVLVAQRSSAQTAPDHLQTALVLFQLGEVQQAQPLFAATDPSDPAYGVAQAYDALCRYELCRAAGTNDYRWFLDAVTSPAVQQAVLPSELREDLTFKHIDARIQSRRLGSANTLSLIASFQTAYPASTHLATLAEYELAARFERGLRSIYVASFDENWCFPEPWTNGLAQLEQFLWLVGNSPVEDYTVLRDRSLAEDLQVALAVLGSEPAALAQISFQDAGSRLRYGLMRVGLEHKLHPEAWERNLQMLANFHEELQSYPASPDGARVKRDLACLAFNAGAQLTAEIAGTPPHEAPTANAKGAAARQYFQTARALQRHVVVDAAARISPTAVAWLWMDYFNSLCCEQDYARLMAAAQAQLTNAAPGDLNWLAAKLYHGVALAEDTPPQLGAAAKAFEAVMASAAQGFANGSFHSEVVLVAARWRVHLALLTGDQAAALQVVQWVEQAGAEPKLKAKFLEDHAWVAAWADTK